MGPTQTLTAIIGLLGGIGGCAALLGQFFQRRKIRAETADVLTDTALTLVQPLQQRVKELEGEARNTRLEVRAAHDDARYLRDELGDVLAMLRRWRATILDHRVSREELDAMVSTEYPTVDRPR
ncbi:MAG: hypothetical protein JF597_00690 [Streptomyces sp.]|uniref:hypothetical protein n=1 Tax=Streptomyces sp. TaxID=1931 RepID=UPI0025E88021|nr:hypothetical protein [Streptomyces sp.]MBW8792155.1 hypothetical protein [Streptomyces sp.]